MQVTTRIDNLSTDPMPVAIGFHPYFQLTDSMRDDWTISVGAKSHWLLDANHLPTGETQAIESFFPDPKVIPLKEYDLDHVFGDLARDGSGRAVMTLKGKAQELDVVLGPNYRAMVIYAPKPKPGTGAGAWAGGGRPELHLLRADGRHHECNEPRPQGALQRPPERASGGDLGRELLGPRSWILTRRPAASYRGMERPFRDSKRAGLMEAVCIQDLGLRGNRSGFIDCSCWTLHAIWVRLRATRNRHRGDTDSRRAA